MKKLFFALLAVSTGVQACELQFINNTPFVVLLSLDEKLGDNIPPSQVTNTAHTNQKNPKTHIINSGMSKKSKPDEDRSWYFYILENQVFVKRYKLNMHACMNAVDSSSKNIALSDLFAKKVNAQYLSVEDL